MAMAGALGVRFRSQSISYPYFVASALLFVLQVGFGLIIAAQFVWPRFLLNVLPFNIGRETHLNLLIFWLLLGLMGAAYFLIPDETDSEIYSTGIAWTQLAVLLVAGVGTLLSFWFLRLSWGKPFTESPRPWPWLIAAGVVLFLINLGVTIFRSRQRTAISLILFWGMVGLAIFYMFNMIFFPNLTVDYYWWWWTIHLWVEGAWELIAAAVTAYLLLKLTGIDRTRLNTWLYAIVSLTLFTGIIGTGHHYYWIGTPRYWLLWGALFSAFEPLPIALMTYDALRNMMHRRVQPLNRVAWYWLGGSAIAHFAGAGVWGFAQTLPQINRWTHGTQITASHGHFAFFGAFGMLVLAAVYYVVPQVRRLPRLAESRGLWAYWLMALGMLAMVAAFSGAGVVQTYLTRVIGLDFMLVREQYVRYWIFWVWAFGLVAFLPGVVVYLLDFFAMHPAVVRAAGR